MRKDKAKTEGEDAIKAKADAKVKGKIEPRLSRYDLEFISRGPAEKNKRNVIHGRKVGYGRKNELEGLSNLKAEIWKGLNSLIDASNKKS